MIIQFSVLRKSRKLSFIVKYITLSFPFIFIVPKDVDVSKKRKKTGIILSVLFVLSLVFFYVVFFWIIVG